MKKILFYIDHKNRGGAQRVMVELANYFQEKKKYKVVFVTQKRSNPTAYTLNPEVKEILLQDNEQVMFFSKQIDRIKRLANVCVAEKPDIIISFLIIANIIALITGKLKKIPVLISVRNDPQHDRSGSLLFQLLMKMTYPWAAGWVFQTEEAHKYYQNWIHGPVSLIMNPISKEVVQEIKKLTNQKSNTSASKLIVAVGRLDRQKRHDILIKAFSKVYQIDKDVKLVIYGEGSLRKSLEQLVDELQLNDCVFLPGIEKNIITKIKNGAVFVMCSDYEGIPNALIEAMAVGLPVVSTDCPCGGPAMLINSGINGILIPVGDEDKLFEAIIYILTNQRKAVAMGKAATAVRELCDIDNIALQWIKIIDKVIDVS